MGELAVVEGAMLKCDKGATPSALTVTTMSLTHIAGSTVATIMDHQPGANIKPFGVCAITQKPCMPVTPIPWAPGATTVGLMGAMFPVVIANSQLPCALGGLIKVLSPGQATVRAGSPVGAPVGGTLLRETLADLGWGVGTGGIAGTMQGAEKALLRLSSLDRAKAAKLGLAPAQRQALLDAARANQNQAGRFKGASRWAGRLGYVPGGVQTIQRAADGDAKGAIAKGAGTVAGGVAGGAATAACVTASGPAAPATALPCAIGGAAIGTGVSMATEWGTEKVIEGGAKAKDTVEKGFKGLIRFP